jgi:hypothetical protein
MTVIAEAQRVDRELDCILNADKMWPVPVRWLYGGPLYGTRAAGANEARVEVGGKSTREEQDLEGGR